jgi:hypothetical protein
MNVKPIPQEYAEEELRKIIADLKAEIEDLRARLENKTEECVELRQQIREMTPW